TKEENEEASRSDGETEESGKGNIELIDEEEDEEALDLSKPDEDINIDVIPRKAEINKEFPEFFKKFPFVEKALYRDKQYSEMFGSFDDAKEIYDKSEVFNEFENQLLAGNT